MEINWRYYQKDCKKAIKAEYDKGVTEQLAVLATGTGKRLMAVDLIRHFKRTLFVCHRKELIIQAFNEIELFFPMETGIIKAERFDIDKRIVVASVQTLYNRLDKIDPETFDLIIVDEAHHFVSKTFLKSIRHFNHRLRVCWTATPKRLDGLSLSNIAQKIVYEYPIEQGIKDEFLAPIEAYQIKTPTDISSVKKVAGDFNKKQLSEKVDSGVRNNLIVDKYLEYAKDRQAIAYCVDIDHSHNLKSAFLDNGISCESVSSDTERCPNRDEIIARFQNGEIEVLTNVEILTEGWDYNDVGCVLMARPTQSETLYTQSIGRGTRLKSQKFIERFNANNCIILDFVDNTGKLSLINAWELEKDKPIEDRMFVSSKHKEKLIAERTKRERKIELTYGADKKINLLKLPEVVPWNSAKMLEPATEKQLKWIKDLGIYVEGIEYTKAMASELISGRPASQNQVIWLANHRYDVSGKVTLGQYQKVKWTIERRQQRETKYKIK